MDSGPDAGHPGRCRRSDFRHQCVGLGRSGALPRMRTQAGQVATTARQHAGVAQMHARIAGIDRFDRLHLTQIDQIAAVDAHEHGRVQFGLDRGHGAAQRVIVTARMQVDVIARGLDPLDIGGGDQEVASQLAHQKSLRALQRLYWRTIVRCGEQMRLALTAPRVPG